MVEADSDVYTIEGIKEENPNVRTFMFDGHFKEAVPGQFLMVGLMDGGEKPFSLSRENAITVRRMPRTKPDVPTFTERMFELDVEGEVYLRGPVGSGFEEHPHTKTYFLIGGGIGLVPLRFAAREFISSSRDIITFAGGKTKEDVLFPDEFKLYGHNRFHVATEDGSEGYKGTVVELMRLKAEELKGHREPEYLLCGPEKMIKAAAELLEGLGIEPEKIQCSIERYMKCGIGLCGACSCGGYRTCVDGPAFTYDVLKRNKHFGKLKREKSGRLVDI